MNPVEAAPEDPLVVELACVSCSTRWTSPLPDVATTPAARRMAWKLARTFTRYCESCLAALDQEAAQTDEVREHAERLRQAKVPVALMAELDQIEPRLGQRAGIEHAARWAAEGGCLFLQGDTGRGKSTIAAAALVSLLYRQPGMWVSAPRLLQMAAADFGSEPHRQAQRVFHSRRALVLDDLGQGATNASDHVRNQLHAAIDARIVDRVPLLITSNHLPTRLASLYGAWLGSRLAGEFAQVRVDGEDHRL